MNDQSIALVRDWYDAEPMRTSSKIGIPNTGLHVLEVFRENWPLRETQYLTRGGGQVAGLSGASGDTIVQRYTRNLRSMGTEAGRTSRSTPAAARRLAERLNLLPPRIAADQATRTELANEMQRWIVEEVLTTQLRSAKPAIEVRPGEPLGLALSRYFDDLPDDFPWRRSAARLLAAAVEVVTQGGKASQEAGPDLAPEGVLRLGDTTVVLSELPTLADVEACQTAVAAGMRCLLLTPDNRVLASAQLLKAVGCPNVEVDSTTRFVSRFVDTAGEFQTRGRDEFVAAINERL